ncbi:MAG: hypothetical protein ACRDRH_00980 [Pseudonocardia sp.]
MRRRESTGGRDGFVQAGEIVDGEVDFIDCRPLGSPERGHRDEDAAPGARPDRAGQELVAADRATGAAMRWAGGQVTRVAGKALALARHERTRAMARWLARNGVLYVATGLWMVGVRLWEARTNSRYERMMRAAETAGDQDRLSDWEFRAEQARERRHRRRMDWLAAPFALAPALAAAAVTILGILLGLGVVLAVAHSDITWLLGLARGGRGPDGVDDVARHRRGSHSLSPHRGCWARWCGRSDVLTVAFLSGRPPRRRGRK